VVKHIVYKDASSKPGKENVSQSIMSINNISEKNDVNQRPQRVTNFFYFS